ncbi:MAG: RagB/SusD family nutrient uptake outer membrane protein [Mediterranea sp.]|jgi:hypothetical protein|nr:RagB/SusD family nutrient uptake outer membrane protein [Mediterranea sp.]
MKKKNIFMCFLTVALLLTGCEDFLHVASDTQKTGGESFRTIEDLRSATAYLYTNPWFEFNSNSYIVLEGRANNIVTDGTGVTYYAYATFSENSSTVGLDHTWNSLYNVITQSDYVVNHYAPTARENGVDETKANACEGEARFMRATAYWYLAMIWHDVPIVDLPEKLVLSPIIPCNRFEDVIQYAINDLEYAAQWLPETDDKGRVTKYSAEAMLARLCLTAANFAQGGHFSQEYLMRNEAASNAELATAYFTQAKTVTNDVLVNSQYGLLDDYEDLFKVKNNNNAETLFGIQFIPGVSTYGLGSTRQDALATGIAAEKNGKGLLCDGLNAWGGGMYGTYDLLHLYTLDGGLSRLRGNLFVASYNYSYLGTHTVNGSWTVENTKCNIKKFVVGSSKDTEGVAINGNNGLVTPIIRLAEVYLMYAEAVLGTADETTDALAVKRFNEVNKRAFYMNPTEYVAKEKITRNDLFKERRMEFFMELLFWPDIKRRSFYDNAWIEKYLNDELKNDDDQTELTNYHWGVYNYDPSGNVENHGWTTNSPRRDPATNPLKAEHNMGSATYVHSVDAKDNIWALPYPEVEASKNAQLNENPVPYNF